MRHMSEVVSIIWFGYEDSYKHLNINQIKEILRDLRNDLEKEFKIKSINMYMGYFSSPGDRDRKYLGLYIEERVIENPNTLIWPFFHNFRAKHPEMKIIEFTELDVNKRVVDDYYLPTNLTRVGRFIESLQNNEQEITQIIFENPDENLVLGVSKKN